MRSLILGTLLAVLSIFNVAIAGCGESEGHCYYYEKGALRSDAPCKIAECANMHGGLQNWQWSNGNEVAIRVENGQTQVNGQPGFYLGLQGVDHLTCYGISGTDELLCTEEK